MSTVLPPSGPAASPPLRGMLAAEVRYSLPALLSELEIDRSNGALALEKLSQEEIRALFSSPTKRRVKKHRP